ncbi:MAG: adenylate/guanylate cyclase domain-containing protein [Planctomycetes bacterium]|nr:adenylate/guanylate cyclase domain-containing protein [Planctomycetota bacterium]MCW8134653.1 adenylate/guanylate cyclase domain-containing protein [Planctomycetota bacterium]
MPFGRKIPRATLERYAGKALVEVAQKNPDVLKLGATRRNVSLVYLDIWGFTEVTSYASPQAVIDLLCDYFSRMTNIIRGNRGFVDKFFGDAIFAIFGAPLDDPQHALHACNAALACLRETFKLAAEWHVQGFGRISQSIGVVTGPAIVGNVGTDERAMYTAIGEAVSLTVQLQQASRLYRAPIIISRDTNSAVREQLLTRELDVVKVHGTERTTTIYELMGNQADAPEHLKMLAEVFNRGVVSFRQRDWDRAEKRFADADKISGDDGPSRLYIRRCQLYRKHPPPPEWDHVHAHTVRMNQPGQ